jgi:hypothetical protein
MRAFLAALWLVEETPTLPALQKIATVSKNGSRVTTSPKQTRSQSGPGLIHLHDPHRPAPVNIDCAAAKISPISRFIPGYGT